MKSVPGGDTAVTGGNFYHSDYLGSVPLITSKNDRGILPASIASRLFAPYGESYGNEGITGDVNFTGDNQDLVAGTFDTPNRELNSTQARWISPDPAHASWNAYSYSTDPLVETDPSGLGPRIPWNIAPITGGMGGEGGGHVSDLSGPGTYIINGVSVSANAFYMQLEIGTGGFGGDFGTWTASGSGMSVASYDYGVVGYEQFGGAVCSDSCDGSGTPDEIAYPIYGLIGETFSDSGGDGGVLMAANNESWAWTFTKSFFSGFSLRSARASGESFSQCVSRVQSAGGSATTAVDAISGVGVATSLASYPSLINTSFGGAVVSNSFIEQAAMESSIVYGSLPASSIGVAQKASSALWSGGGLVTAGALGLEGGVLGACR